MKCPKDCPEPGEHQCQVTIPHDCWPSKRGTHVHLPKKGMAAGRPSRIVGFACLATHDAADNGLRYQGKRWTFGLTDTHWTVTATTKDGDMRAQMIPLEGRAT